METFIKGQNRYNNMGSHNHQKAAITKERRRIRKENDKSQTNNSLGEWQDVMSHEKAAKSNQASYSAYIITDRWAQAGE